MLNQIYQIIRKEALTEWRNKYALGGIVLYVFSAAFLVYISIAMNDSGAGLDKKFWNLLFWLIALFSAVNAVAKSFQQESSGRFFYYYYTMKPEAIIVAKMLYNFFWLTVICLLTFVCFSLFFGHPVENSGMFSMSILSGAMGLSFLFTFVSSIAAKSNNNSTLMAILGFPLVLPLILFILRLSRECFFTEGSADMNKYLISLLAIDLVIFMLALILYPFLWRD